MMNRRNVLGLFGGAAAGMAVNGALAQGKRAANKGGGEHDQMAHDMAKTCADCAHECNEGFHHCHQQLAAGKKEYAMAAHLCVDTADCCSMAAAICARVSPLMGICCQCCADGCDICIAECEKLNDPELEKVVEACRKTAKECRAMAKMMAGKK